MTKTVVYAVGGTGAKVLESVIHLCVAGVFRGSVAVRLVDQDETNGNARRVRMLMDQYGKIRAWLRREGGGVPADCPLFSAEISDGGEVLRVLPDAMATLANSYGLAGTTGAHLGEDDLLMQALFSAEERNGRMLNGFRGQPAVGAAAFLSPQSRTHSKLWSLVRGDEAEARNGGVSRFLFLGSIFGGTGAAGVPTLASYLRQCLRSSAPRVRLGAVLMLRYDDIDKRAAFGPALPAQVRAALEFYNGSLRRGTFPGNDTLLDRLYLAGLSHELAVLADAEGGGDAQSNPALMPELVGALAAAHFHGDIGLQSGPRGIAEIEPGKPVWLCGHASKETVTWADLPAPPGCGSADDPRRLLCSLARFSLCYTFGLHGAPNISEVPFAGDLPMYFRFLDRERLTAGEYDVQARQLNDYCMRFLRWFGAMHYTANAADWPRAGQITFGLSLAERLVAPQAGHEDRFELGLNPEKLAQASRQDRDLLMQTFDSLCFEQKAPGFVKVLDRLAVTTRPRVPGLGALVSGAYGVSALPIQ